MSTLDRLSTHLHTIFCQKEHAQDMLDLTKERNPKVCYFYLENSMSRGEDEEDHQYWKREAEVLCKELQASPDDVIRILSSLLELRRKLDDFLAKYPNSAEIAHRFLFDETV